MGSILVLPVDNRSRNIVGNQRCGIRLANLVAPTIEIDTGRTFLVIGNEMYYIVTSWVFSSPMPSC